MTVLPKTLSGTLAGASRERDMYVGLVEVSCITSRIVRYRTREVHSLAVKEVKKGRLRRSDVRYRTYFCLCLLTMALQRMNAGFVCRTPIWRAFR